LHCAELAYSRAPRRLLAPVYTGAFIAFRPAIDTHTKTRPAFTRAGSFFACPASIGSCPADSRHGAIASCAASLRARSAASNDDELNDNFNDELCDELYDELID